tara:strand:- start:33 stop:344 length:312 start_codon:yes stop_codon:yes gene_type:complete
MIFPYNICVPNSDIDSVIKNKKSLERYKKARALFKKKHELWRGETKLVFSHCIKLLIYAVSLYDYSATVISRSVKRWWLRKILEEYTKIPTDVINHGIFNYIF